MKLLAWLTRGIDGLSAFCFVLSILSLIGLVTVLLVEVVSRYGLNAPSIWAYDVTTLLTASAFILACAWCQRNDENIRIDSLVTRVRPTRRAAWEAIFLVFLLLPPLAVLAYTAAKRAYSSFITGEVDNVSPWGPRLWPFFLVVALGLVALLLQTVVSTIQAINRTRGAAPPPPAATIVH